MSGPDRPDPADRGLRVGWLLRTSREAAGLSLRQVSAALGDLGTPASPATLSRLEGDGAASAAVVGGYTRVLGLPPAGLRCAVGLLRHTGPAPLPDPALAAEPSLARFSAAYDAVTRDGTGAAADGEAWLDFAREHAIAGFGLPAGHLRAHVGLLVDELERSVGHALWARYAALTRLRGGRYAEVVEELLRERAEDPDRPAVSRVPGLLPGGGSGAGGWTGEPSATADGNGDGDRDGAAWSSLARGVGAEVARRHDRGDDPVLVQLIVEALGRAGHRRRTARMLLGASAFARTVPTVLLERAADAPGPAGRARVLRAAAGCHAGHDLSGAAGLLVGDGDADGTSFALGVLGRCGQVLPDDALGRELASETRAGLAVWAAGLAGDPRLAAVAQDASRPAAVRRDAARWVARGGRLLE